MSKLQIQVLLAGKTQQTIPFEKETLSIGRLRDNDIVLDNLDVSRHHARLKMQNDLVTFEDLDSENGSYVNGVKVKKLVLTPDDEIVIGKFRLVIAPTQIEESPFPEFESEHFEPQKSPVSGPPEPTENLIQLNPVFIVNDPQGELEQTYHWENPEMIIGRAPDCDLVFDRPQVSRKHALLKKISGQFQIEDLDTGNGTLVNNKKIRKTFLNQGDQIAIGHTILTFSLVPMEDTGLNAPNSIILEITLNPAEIPQEVLEILKKQGETGAVGQIRLKLKQ